jgi:hypothetical protein
MASSTTNLGLTKPAFNEFINGWGDELNDNWDTIDTAVGALQTLTAGSAGGYATLLLRLDAVDSSIAVGAGFGNVGNWATPAAFTAAQTFGPTAAAGQSYGSQVVHGIKRDLIGASEPSVLVPTLPLSQGRMSGWLKRGQHSGNALRAGGDPNKLYVGVSSYPAYVFCDGQVGKLRTAPGDVEVDVAGSAGERRWMLGTVGVDSSITGTGTGETQSANTFKAVGPDWDEVEAGDLLQITAGDTLLDGTYLIASVDSGNNKCTIRGAFWKKFAGGLNFTIHRRGWLTVADTADAAIDSIHHGVAYDSNGAALGTLLGHVDLDGSGEVTSGGIVEYAFGDTYDSGWQAAGTFFDNGVALTDGADVTFTVPFPDVPLGGWQLLWSDSADGDPGVPVPMEIEGVASGVRTSWSKNKLTVRAVDAANVLREQTGAAVSLISFNGGVATLRLIARR